MTATKVRKKLCKNSIKDKNDCYLYYIEYMFYAAVLLLLTIFYDV